MKDFKDSTFLDISYYCSSNKHPWPGYYQSNKKSESIMMSQDVLLLEIQNDTIVKLGAYTKFDTTFRYRSHFYSRHVTIYYEEKDYGVNLFFQTPQNSSDRIRDFQEVLDNFIDAGTYKGFEGCEYDEHGFLK